MPLYEFECPICKAKDQRLATMKEAMTGKLTPMQCLICKIPMNRKYSTAGHTWDDKARP